mgnify:CR=1 FL=1
MQPMRNLAAAGVALLCWFAATPHAAGPYRLVPNWGTLPNGATWGEVPGMAIDADGVIYAFHRADTPIVELDRSGAIRKMWGEKTFAWPHGIRVDPAGNIWITDGDKNKDGTNGEMVYKFSRDYKLLMTIGTRGLHQRIEHLPAVGGAHLQPPGGRAARARHQLPIADHRQTPSLDQPGHASRPRRASTAAASRRS